MPLNRMGKIYTFWASIMKIQGQGENPWLDTSVKYEMNTKI